MEYSLQVNIALSGWSGAGTTTVTLMLAVLLKRRYYYLGSVFREAVRKLKIKSFDKAQDKHEKLKIIVKSSKFETGSGVDIDLPSWEAYLQPYLGRVMDLYVDWVLLNKKGIILETDLSVFRIGKVSGIFSIFLKTDFETRAKRFVEDGRFGGEKVLRERDRVLREEYRKLWDIDVFDEELIAEKFNVVIDNSRLTVEETLTEINSNFEILNSKQIKILNFKIQNEDIKGISKYVGPGGEEDFEREKLESEDLLVSIKEMVVEMNRLFADEIGK